MVKWPPSVPQWEWDYVGDTDPTTQTTVKEGETWFDSVANEGYVFDGTAWVKTTVGEYVELGGTIPQDDIANDTVIARMIAADAVTNTQVANDAVDTAEIVTDAVTATELSNSAVSESHLSFSTATQTELDNHAGAAEAHHAVPDGVPSGSIMMWSGTISDVPSGWVLCDGANGTPDLRDKFVAGAGSTYSAGDTGGSDSVAISESEMPSHNHGVSDSGHSHSAPNNDSFVTTGGSNVIVGNSAQGSTDGSTESSTTGISIDYAGSNSDHENRPPYHALAYMQKV